MKKVIIAGITGAVAYFLIGWVVFGILMKDFYATHMNTSIQRAETDMVWWALILSNLIWGFFMAYVLNRFGNANSFSSGRLKPALALRSATISSMPWRWTWYGAPGTST